MLYNWFCLLREFTSLVFTLYLIITGNINELYVCMYIICKVYVHLYTYFYSERTGQNLSLVKGYIGVPCTILMFKTWDYITIKNGHQGWCYSKVPDCHIRHTRMRNETNSKHFNNIMYISNYAAGGKHKSKISALPPTSFLALCKWFLTQI